MYYVKLLKKYGITVAAAFMVAVMLCSSPLMAMADDTPAPAASQEDQMESETVEDQQKETGKKKEPDKKDSENKKDSDQKESGSTEASDQKESEDTESEGKEKDGDTKDKDKEKESESEEETGQKETEASSESESQSETAETQKETAESSQPQTESETKETAETVLIPETQTSGQTQKSETGKETETEETVKAPNKGKKKKTGEKKEDESKKGSEKEEKDQEEKATEKKKTKASAGERSAAQTSISSHLTGVAPWKGHLVNLPDLVVKQELRFKTIRDVTVKAAAEKVDVFEKKKNSSRKVGYIKAGGQVTVLTSEDGWDYIECGSLRGFIKDSNLRDAKELEEIRAKIIRKAAGSKKGAEAEKIESQKNEEFASPAVLTVDAVENEALTYKKVTAQNTVISKKYALIDTAQVIDGEEAEESAGERSAEKKQETGSAAEESEEEAALLHVETAEDTQESESSKETADDSIKVTQAESVDIKEEKSVKSRTIGTIKDGGLVYIIADKDQEWVFVESGDVRGFIENSYLKTGKDVNKKVKKKGENKFASAKKKVDPAENQAFYYSLLTTVDKTAEQEFRETIIKAAAQCIGNPYVWGGTSLVNGADCSGFVQTLYRSYGISLPRVADDQSEVGTKVTLESAEAGDLIFFADSSGYVYHVAISTGDGGTIEARSERYGIVRVKDRSGAAWATDIISDMFEE